MALGSQLNVALGTQAALAILGELSSAVSAAGTGQSTATLLTTANNIVTTTGAGAGVRLPASPIVSANDTLYVANHGANTLAAYPPTGGKLSNNAANVPALIAPNKAAFFLCINGADYSAFLSA